MKHQHHGFLFAHHDSRGGTSFIEASDETTALAKYAEAFIWWDDADPDAAQHWSELLENLKDETLGPAIIETDLELVDGQELDGSFSGTLQTDDNDVPIPGGVTAYLNDPKIEGDGLIDVLDAQPDGPVVIFYGPFPGAGFIAPRWDDDAYGLVFETTGPNPAAPGEREPQNDAERWVDEQRELGNDVTVSDYPETGRKQR
jgi:hypothetical protein